MDEFSQPLSLGPTSGQRSQPLSFQTTSRNRTQEFDDLQLEDKRLHGYDKDQSMSSFQYSNYIPGFRTSPMSSNIVTFPARQFRKSSSYQSPVITPIHNRRHESSNLSGSPHLKSYHQKLSIHELSPRIALAENIGSSHTATVQPIEEGEVTEGEYDEAGTEQEQSGVPEKLKGKEQHNKVERNPTPAHHALYIKSLDYEVERTDDLVDEYGRSLALNRRSAASCSHKHPNQSEYNIVQHGPQRAGYEQHMDLSLDTESVHGSEGRRDNNLESPGVNNLENAVADSNAEQNHSVITSLPLPVHSPNISATQRSLTFQSVHDARREAQNAILNLWPLKVRLQNYVDEGIDGEIVRRQFEELGMVQNHLVDERTGHVENNTPVHSTEQSPVLMKTISPTCTENIGSKPGNKEKGEQDLIVEPLTKNNEKLASPTMKELGSSNSLETSSSKKTYSNSLTNAKANKERLLQQKMEALQKSREQRAQKAAAKSNTSITAVTPTVFSQLPITQHSKDTTSVLSQHVNYPIVESTKPVPAPPIYNAGTTKTSTPTIPGLFLAASTNTTQALTFLQDNSSLTVSSNVRKRPVASDFDSPLSSTDSYKRPFGQSRNEQRLVIDVSEDESDSESSEMEVDSKSEDKSTHPASDFSNNKLTTVRDLPPLTDFPQRKQFQMPRSTMSTPTLQSVNKSTIPNPEDLLKKEMEIQKMKKKIEEAERKQRAKMKLSGSQTPLSNESSSSSKSANETTIVDKVEASIQIEHLIDDTSRNVEDERVIEIHMIKQTEDNELKDEAEQRALRRAKIASDLPAVDAEVARSQKKLAEMRAEMAQLEAVIQQGLEEKRRLAEEMNQLGQESEEQSQKYNAKHLGITSDDAGSDSDNSFPATQAIEDNSQGSKPTTPPNVINALPGIEPAKSQDAYSTSISDVSPIATSNVPDDESGIDLDTTEVSDDSVRDHSDLPCGSPNHEVQSSLHDISPNPGLHSQEMESDVDMEDSYTLDPNNLASALVTSSISENQQESRHIQGMNLPSHEDGESDPYEPPEATQSTSEPSPSGSSPFSPAPPELGSQKSQTDLQTQQMPSRDATSMTLTVSPANNHHVLPLTETVIDRDNSVGTSRKSYFTPYESPLKKFRSYRFHPTFEKDVVGGFKSLTYSNNIKDNQEICRYELAGGVCNDPSCEFQHFKTMGLADDAILFELGNSAGYREEDKPRFVSGLRAVLQELRAKKTKDFQVIAAEIAAFRARFLQDKSKIILLDG